MTTERIRINYPNIHEYNSIHLSDDDYKKNNVPKSIHDHTREMIKIIEVIIGKKEDEPVSKNDFSHSGRSFTDYSRRSSSWYCPPTFVDRSINIGNTTTYNNIVNQQPSESGETKKKGKEKEEDNQRKIIGIIAGIAVVPLTYVFGRLLGAKEATNNQMKALKSAEKNWEENKKYYQEDIRNSMKIISDTSNKILNKRMRKNVFDLASVISLLGSCVLAAVGAFNKSNALVKAGVISGGVVVGGNALYYLVTLGYSHGRGVTSEVEIIKNQLDFIKAQEECCIELTDG